MFTNPDEILVVDFEMTEANEIIQIGWCHLRLSSGDPVGERHSILIKPSRSRLTPFITELTGITPKQLRSGVPWADACRTLLRKAGPRQRAWAAFGEGDRDCARDECNLRGIPNPFGSSFIDVSGLGTLLYGFPQGLGLTAQMARFDLSFDGRPHDAADDAWNTARLLGQMVCSARRSRDVRVAIQTVDTTDRT